MRPKEDIEAFQRLGEIALELRETEPRDFPAKYALNLEADKLRRGLAEVSEQESVWLKAWAERAPVPVVHDAEADEARRLLSVLLTEIPPGG